MKTNWEDRKLKSDCDGYAETFAATEVQPNKLQGEETDNSSMVTVQM